MLPASSTFFAAGLLALGLLASPAAAADPVRIAAPAPAGLTPAGTATVRLNLEIKPPYHIFSTLAQLGPRGTGPNSTTVTLKPGSPFTLAGALQTSPAKKAYDPSFELDVFTWEGKAWIDVPLRATAALPPGEHRATLVVGYQACDEETCLPPTEVEVPLRLVALPPAAADAAEPRWLELEKRLTARPPATARESQWVETATLAWTLFEAHPTDARRWSAWDTLLRSTPRFANEPELKRTWEEREARLAAAAAAAKDAPSSLRELFAGKKVSALVLPFTNGTLPADWQTRLVPPIEELAAAFPDGTGAFVYFARLVGAVEAQFPAAMPTLVDRLVASPNSRVREYGVKRRAVLAALAQPLDLVFTALDGRAVDTKQWRGKVVIVDFWATWCVPCIEAMPHLKELYAKYHARGLEVITISVDQAAARPALEKLVAKLELPWPQAFDGKGPQTEFAVRYGVQPIPHVLLAGPDGHIVAVNPRGPRLEAEIQRLLAKAQPASPP
jgi:thiol-disulfide isomerase/thioredoxin